MGIMGGVMQGMQGQIGGYQQGGMGGGYPQGGMGGGYQQGGNQWGGYGKY